MIEKLREATQQLHTEIEKQNLAYLIINHSIKIKEYKCLLLQNYIAYTITENEIKQHVKLEEPLKSDLLLRDLQALKVDKKIIKANLKKFKHSLSITNYHEALGAKYVVDGSALGGMLIAKNLPLCKELSRLPSPIFFKGDRLQVKQWNSFSKILKQAYTPEEESIAIEKAKKTFIFFGEVFSDVSLKEIHTIS